MSETIEIFTCKETGIELKIFTRPSDPKLPFGFRYFDIDSGNVVGMIFCPTLELAQQKFQECKDALYTIPANTSILI